MMSSTESKLLKAIVSKRLNDATTEIYESILGDLGIDIADLEIGFPYDGDVVAAFDDMVAAMVGILEATINLHFTEEE